MIMYYLVISESVVYVLDTVISPFLVPVIFLLDFVCVRLTIL